MSHREVPLSIQWAWLGMPPSTRFNGSSKDLHLFQLQLNGHSTNENSDI